MSLLKEDVDFLRTEKQIDLLKGVDPLTSSIGAADVAELLGAAEAKATYGLINNYQSLEALSSILNHKLSIGKNEIKQLLDNNGVKNFSSPFLASFHFDPYMSWSSNSNKMLNLKTQKTS